MSLKIGEVLLKEGLITKKQLEEALKSQVIFGGRLGTNLVEMGILDELDLLRCLSKQLEVPYVSVDLLASVPPEIIKLIPAEIAEEYKIVPLNLEKKRLTVAMWDPADLAAIDAISFITGYIIIPVVCSELRLLLALEQYYGIKRELRYIQLSGGTGKRSREVEGSTSAAPHQEPEEISPFENLSGEALAPAGTDQAYDPEWGDFAEILPTEPNTEPAAELLQINRELPAIEPDVLELNEIQPEITPPEMSATTKTASQEALPKAAGAPISLDQMLAALAEARDRDAIADAVIGYVGQEYERVALFMIKGKVAAGWRASLRQKTLAGFENFQLSLDELSILRTVTDTKNFYIGPVLENPGNKTILAALGGGAPQTALLIPLMMMGRVVTVFYVDGGKDVSQNLKALQKIAAKTSLAFEVLILKNKILG